MFEYEKQLSEYIISQIYILFGRLYVNPNEIPQYEICCNFESDMGINQYMFKGITYQEYAIGQKIRGTFWEINDDCEGNVQFSDLCDIYELVLGYTFSRRRFHIMFSTLKRPYINLFLNFVIRAYFETKSEMLRYVLEDSSFYEHKEAEQYEKKNIFRELCVDVEEEVIISRAVTNYFYNAYNLDINVLSFISSQTYEGIYADGNIYICRRGTDRGKRNGELIIKFKESIKFHMEEVRKIRKLLEIAKNPLSMVVDDKKNIIGYTLSEPKKYEGKIVVSGKMAWELWFGRNCLTYHNGVYRIISQNADSKYEFSAFDISREQKIKINTIIAESRKQTHGTSLIFGNTEDIVKETLRLSKYGRAMMLRTIDLMQNIELLINLTSIDGAILVDFDCKCYAIGAILDGDVVTKGVSERGARYNSVVNYVERKLQDNIKLFAIIVSEDKTVDVYPK